MAAFPGSPSNWCARFSLLIFARLCLRSPRINVMQVYDHPTFRMACRQFDLVADHLQIPDSERDRLKFPKRSMTVAVPIQGDDGKTHLYTGYRVQHHLTLG